MRKRQRQESSNTGNWLTTYADMVTLLLCFFVLLFAFSSIDEGRFSSIINAFQNYLGVMTQGQSIMDRPGPLPFEYSDIGHRQLMELFEEMTEFIEEEGLQGVELELQERGLIIRFAEQ
ncbi:MAG: flagellar motor protein MotB, partial [Bacillota bacterium]|nr:flagellar motor protein MotB [Bacillota bacterium]